MRNKSWCFKLCLVDDLFEKSPLTSTDELYYGPRLTVVACFSQENSCDSEPVVEVEAPPPAPATLPPRVTAPAASNSAPADPEEPEDPDAEPAFKTDKERECWQMFRKMADKGVSVSYDTVLRWG